MAELWHEPEDAGRLVVLPIERIRAARLKTRLEVSEAQLMLLAESIRQHGLLHPIAVRLARGGMYELISGERRLRALVLLGRTDVMALVLDASDLEAALISLTENLQRDGLHYLEEAEAFRAVIQDHGLTQAELAERVGRSQGMVANRLRLLGLSEAVRAALRAGGLSERHARALLRLKTESMQLEAAAMIQARNLSVRQTEELVVRLSAMPNRKVSFRIRDRRMLINTVLASVKQLRSVGIDATGEVVEKEDRIEVIVGWKK